MPALQSTVLGDHEALVVPQRGAGAIRLAREALVLVVAPLVFSHVGVAGVNGDSVLAGIMVDGLVIPTIAAARPSTVNDTLH